MLNSFNTLGAKRDRAEQCFIKRFQSPALPQKQQRKLHSPEGEIFDLNICKNVGKKREELLPGKIMSLSQSLQDYLSTGSE